MEASAIIAKLPYSKPFLFVDELLHVDENGAEGTFTFDESLDFYKGHFKDNPITPGVILTEAMAQIGVVCLGIYLLNDNLNSDIAIALTSAETEFLKPVYPNEKVRVKSEKIYYRFGKLKCKVIMYNETNEEICRGKIAGMIISKNE
ncbi:beta-hydroxyacyl-ACP dehydratase [Flavobacterium sp. J372]|uniref:3-hydroxyacyl-ACP dehydratase FabZ family protein n=1 Tax=Flavobacterium sp. J372 TaxID=2898436 RepID=UPI0021514D5F|nr:3-hydroxyacyl-ACP dehydratase FabZ family protein [Flavobacterium sp. J372]MCR5862493.1 beta-hydroxyacyl-ACP dehydratase [Flavobacterium sp. J372]